MERCDGDRAFCPPLLKPAHPAHEVLLNAGTARETAEKWNIRAEDMDYIYNSDS